MRYLIALLALAGVVADGGGEGGHRFGVGGGAEFRDVGLGEVLVFSA